MVNKKLFGHFRAWYTFTFPGKQTHQPQLGGGMGRPTYPGGGGGYLGTEWIPTAKRPPRAEAVSVKN